MIKNKVVKVSLPIKLHPAQKLIHDSPARFKVVQTGCRFGKTELGMVYLIEHALSRPGFKHWIVFPFAKQGRSILWNRIISFLPKELLAKKPNVTTMDIRLANGSEIGIRGSDNEMSLRGEKLGSVIMDEAAFQQSHVWEEILRPRLIDSRGDAMFISSPFGRGWHYKLLQFAKSGVDNEWAGWHFTTYDNPHISKDELDKLKTTTAPRIWKREYMGEALDDEGLVYGEAGGNNFFDSSMDYLGHESTTQCGRGIDWGAGADGDPTACVWVHISGNDVLVSQEYEQENWSVQRHAAAISDKSIGRKLIDGMTILDKSAFNTQGSSMTSIGKLLSDNGVHCIRSEADKDSGISIIKALLDGSGDSSRLRISDKCVNIKKGLQSWEFGKHEPDCLAALRYVITAMYKRGLLKLNNAYMNSDKPQSTELPPGMVSIFRRAIPEDENLSWNFDSGYFE